MKKELIIEKFAIGKNLITELKVPHNESKIKISEGKTADVIMRVKHPIGIVDEFTANKTYYEKQEVETAFENGKEVMENGGFGGYANHPEDNKEADVLRTTHYTRKMWIENGLQIAESDIINTSAGKDLAVMLRTGRVGVSTRNYGVKESYKEGTTIKELEANGYDYVEVPSAGIYTNPKELETESLDTFTDLTTISENKKDSEINNDFDKSTKTNKKTGEVNMEKLALKKLKLDIKGLVKEAITLKPLQAIKELNSIREDIEIEGLEDMKEIINARIAELEAKIEKMIEANDDAGTKVDKKDNEDMDTGLVDTKKQPKGDKVDTKDKGVEEAEDKKDDKKDVEKSDDKKDEEKKSDDKKDEEKKDDKEEKKKDDVEEEVDTDKKDTDKSDDKKDEEKKSDDKKDEEKKDDKEEKKESKIEGMEKTLENIKTLESHIVKSNGIIEDMATELFEKVQYAKTLEKAGLKTKDYSKVLEAELLKAKDYIETLEKKVVEQHNSLTGVGRQKDQDVSIVEHLENYLNQYPQLEQFKTELSFIPTKDGITEAVNKHISIMRKAKITESQFNTKSKKQRLDLPNDIFESRNVNLGKNEEKSYEAKVLEQRLGSDYI